MFVFCILKINFITLAHRKKLAFMANHANWVPLSGGSIGRGAAGLLRKGRRTIKSSSLKNRDADLRSEQQKIYWRGRLAYSRRKRVKKIIGYTVACVAVVLLIYALFF